MILNDASREASRKMDRSYDRSVVSKSLLESVSKTTSQRTSSLFCLGLADYCDCENCASKKREDETEAPAKRLKLSLPKDKPRFATPLPEAKMAEISKGKKCANTERSTSWAVTTFKQWMKERNKACPNDLCPDNFLEANHSNDVSNLQRWLCRFVIEARKQGGEPYPPTTLQSLLSGLLRYMRERRGDTPDFLSKKDARFRDLQRTLESTFSELRKKGVGAEVKRTPAITKEEEDQLWRAGVMGVDTPKQLLNTVFFYVGKVFCLRGGVEQRGLKISQFQRRYSPDHYVYVENGSKNNSGANLRVENKVVLVYSNPEYGSRCVVSIIDKYISKLPPLAFEKDIFYMRPKSATPGDPDMPWYESIPVGKETLRTMLANMCNKAGIEKKTNHSLRATGATEMFAANIPEKLIQSRTGHRSVEALRLYERPLHDQHQAVSNVLTSAALQRSFGKELTNLRSSNSQNTGVICRSTAENRATRSTTVQSPFPTNFQMPALFGNMNHCSVNININMNQPAVRSSVEEFDELVSDVNFEL